MIIVLKQGFGRDKAAKLIASIMEKGYKCELIDKGEASFILVSGNTHLLDIDLITSYDIVEKVERLKESYYLASREKKRQDTVIDINGRKLGGDYFQIIAGPCTIENEAMLYSAASKVQEAGISFFRAGAYKPRTSPYSFQGLGKEGLLLLSKVKKEFGLITVTELTSEKNLSYFDDVDVIQIGARNMQNYELLKTAAKIGKPIILKRGMASTLEEWLLCAEYILNEGNGRVILCERGVRSFNSSARYVLDLAAIPILLNKTHLPVIVDPSHATGNADYVPPMSLAAISAGAKGLLIEVNDSPESSLCDGKQALNYSSLTGLVEKSKPLISYFGKHFE